MFRVGFDECALVIPFCSAPFGQYQRPAFGAIDSITWARGRASSVVICKRYTFDRAICKCKNTICKWQHTFIVKVLNVLSSVKLHHRIFCVHDSM